MDHGTTLRRLVALLIGIAVVNGCADFEPASTLVEFVGNGLLGPEARAGRLRRLVPERLLRGRAGLSFR